MAIVHRQLVTTKRDAEQSPKKLGGVPIKYTNTTPITCKVKIGLISLSAGKSWLTCLKCPGMSSVLLKLQRKGGLDRQENVIYINIINAMPKLI